MQHSLGHAARDNAHQAGPSVGRHRHDACPAFSGGLGNYLVRGPASDVSRDVDSLAFPLVSDALKVLPREVRF